MQRLVLDTNVLVADAYSRSSASARIVEACLDGRLVAVLSPELLEEYDFILPRAVRVPGWRERYDELRRRAHRVELDGPWPRVVPEDRSDDVLFATAIAGRAEAIITNDAPVLRVGEYQGVRVVTPGDALGDLDRLG